MSSLEEPRDARQEIDRLLLSAYFSVFSYPVIGEKGDPEVRTDAFIFAHTPSGELFLFCQKSPTSFTELKSGSFASILIYKEERASDDVAFLNLRGQASWVKDSGDEAVRNALDLLGEKSPRVRVHDPEAGDFTLLAFEPLEMSFAFHRDIRQGLEPTILSRGENWNEAGDETIPRSNEEDGAGEYATTQGSNEEDGAGEYATQGSNEEDGAGEYATTQGSNEEDGAGEYATQGSNEEDEDASTTRNWQS